MLLMMGGFWVACVLSAVLEGEPFAAALDVGKLFVLVWMVLNLVRTPERYRTYEMLVLMLISYVALVVTYRSATGQVMQDTEVERAAATGVLGDPNDSAAVIAAGVALALTAALDRSRRYWWLFYPLAAVMAWSIYLTQSRGGMLALVVAIGGSIVVCSRRRARGMALAAVVGLLLIYTVGGRITNFDSQEVSANERLWYWDNGLAMLKSNPLFGAGYGQFTVHNDGRAAHGSLPLAIGETGFVGCFFWLGMFYFAFHGPQATHSSVPLSSAAVTGHGPPVALAAYLVAVTFLSHTYLPVLYVLATLPVTARFAMNMPASVELSSSRIEFPDFVRIGAMTLAAPVVVKLLIWRFG